MSSTAFAAVLAFAAGLGGAVQIAVQGRLGDRVGSLEAVTTAAVIGCAVALAALVLARRSVAGVGEAVTGPKWLNSSRFACASGREQAERLIAAPAHLALFQV